MKEISESVDAHGRLKQAASERRAYGLLTSKSNRDYFYGILEMLVEEHKEILCTKYLVEDIAGLIRKPGTGRVEAGPGSTIIIFRPSINLVNCWKVYNQE